MSSKTHRSTLATALVTGATVLTMQAVACAGVTHEIAKLVAADGAPGDQFGYRIGLSGHTLVVGAPRASNPSSEAGAAYLFNLTNHAAPVLITKLTPNDPETGARFGVHVAINGGLAVVGANLKDEPAGNDAGAAYLFDAATGQQLAKLTPSDAEDGARFGQSVHIDGSLVIVGAYWDDAGGLTDSGAAYVFDVSTPTSPVQLTKLAPNDPVAFKRFGSRVALSGTVAAVGRDLDDDHGSQSGAVYLFDALTGAQHAKLTPADISTSDRFGGGSLLLQSGLLYAGSPNADPDSLGNAGASYLFDVSDPSNPVELLKILPCDLSSGDEFRALALDGSRAVGGSPGDADNGNGSGSAYVFDTTTGRQFTKLLPTDGASSERFGETSGAIEGSLVVVSAWLGANDSNDETGAVYVFDVAGVAPACIGDLNCDEATDVFDFSIFAAAFATSFGDAGFAPIADLDHSQSIDVFDFAIWAADFGCTP